MKFMFLEGKQFWKIQDLAYIVMIRDDNCSRDLNPLSLGEQETPRITQMVYKSKILNKLIRMTRIEQKKKPGVNGFSAYKGAPKLMR